MNPSSSVLFSLSLLPLMLAACGGTGGATGGGGSSSASTAASTGDTTSAGGGPALSPEMQMAKFCADTTAPFCKALFACCTTDPQTLTSEGGTEAGCEAKAGDCTGQLTAAILSHLKAGDTVLDPSRLAACVARLASMEGGGATCTRPADIVFLDDCFAAFAGTLAPGATCDATGLGDISFILCDKGNCTMGKCVPFLALGAPCQNPNMAAGGCDYVHGEYCQITAGKGTCAPVGKVGDKACDLETDPGFSCDSATCDTNLQCVSPTPDRLCKLL